MVTEGSFVERRITLTTERTEKLGPLRWMRGLVREDPEVVHQQILELPGAGPDRMRLLEDLAFRAIDSVLDRTDANYFDVAAIYGGAQFLDSAATARELICRGYIRGALFHVRSLVETFAVLEYLYGDEERSTLWSKAETKRERKAFEFAQVYKETPRAESWNALWELLKDKTHANRGSFPPQSRLRTLVGGDTWIGPFYDPMGIVLSFLTTLTLIEWFANQLGDWYESDGILPDGWRDDWDHVGSFREYEAALTSRAEAESARIQLDHPGSISLEEQKLALEEFDRVAASLGKPPVRNHDE